MRFSQDFIDKVRESNNIVEIIGQYTELKGSGHRRMGRCPFPDHNEKTPSFSVTDDNQLFYCYGCKKGGNVYNFLQYFNGMSFPEAVEFLARRSNIALPELEEGSRFKPRGPSHEDKETLLKINKATAVFLSPTTQKSGARFGRAQVSRQTRSERRDRRKISDRSCA